MGIDYPRFFDCLRSREQCLGYPLDLFNHGYVVSLGRIDTALGNDFDAAHSLGVMALSP